MAHHRCLVVAFILPKSGWAIAHPPLTPLLQHWNISTRGILGKWTFQHGELTALEYLVTGTCRHHGLLGTGMFLQGDILAPWTSWLNVHGMVYPTP